MHYNYKLNKQAITNIIKRHTKFKTSILIVKNKTNSTKIYLNQTNVRYKFICPFRVCLPKNKTSSYIGYTTITIIL